MTYSAPLSIFLLFLLVSCQASSITDTSTPIDLPNLSPRSANERLVQPLNDNMDRGTSNPAMNTVIDFAHYQANHVERGDVIWYEGKFLSRVVALPSEQVSIRKGQLLVNGHKLDTFYGKAHVGGMEEKEFKRSDIGKKEKDVIVDEVYRLDMEEVALSDDEVFVVGDNWFRNEPGSTIKKVKVRTVEGKAIGICKSCASPQT
ncbi:hypothetical protein J31TS4_41410 [Paenibacillus sp. J31TS4]|uniref:S26 family signal peptidase n=1 Tax=Paenibacillus sp. J31TS4 TaxID=2807195 RepID=UPI001B05B919|nr:S26 family signal peptidase [Paenibacillus sp. J31TS4]GIP40861.1 hypothetical protein J31TS4_41410 [Paenibacillus sp. J31TS4]